MTDETLLIVGASVRAAAQSARRAGWQVSAVDLFADVDLQAIAPTWQASDYPDGLVAAAAQAPPGPWLYTGGLENHAEVVAAISRNRTLLGNGPAVLQQCQAPFEFRHACLASTLGCVNWCEVASETPSKGKWMLKPHASAGGKGITLYERAPYPVAPPTHYWEEYIEGDSQSAVYVASDTGWRLLGVTEQLIGTEWTGATGFHYAGSLGPLVLDGIALVQYHSIGEALHKRFGLRGLFGVDAIFHASGALFPIELNPRYTASIEVLERSLGIHAIDAHVQACRDGQLPKQEYDNLGSERPSGKAILYARKALQIGTAFADWCREQNAGTAWPVIADLPAAGTRIEPGQPIVTVFADGRCIEDTRFALRQQAEHVFARLEA